MKSILCLLFFAYSTIGFAQDAESVLKSLQDKFDSITDLSVDVTQKSNGKSSLSGKMYFKRKIIYGLNLVIK